MTGEVMEMKKGMLTALVLGLVLPLALLPLALPDGPVDYGEREPIDIRATEMTEAARQMLTVLNENGAGEEMALSDYLTGVVLAEMPADFHQEALKAQAVVARTYTMKRQEGGKHTGAAVCMDSACCQGFRSAETYLADGGSQASVDRVRQAVADTEGQVLTYDGALIDAVYFSCSGGMTEAAVEVWGSDVPYLQVVESPGEEDAVHYADRVSFTPAEFAEKTGCTPQGQPEDWFGTVTYTDGGGVETMEICGRIYKGTELRQLLGLRSTVFSVAVDDGQILIHTRGFGHRVGMSQYGAQAMAEAGSGYDEILSHYYQGTVLEKVGE